MIVHEFSIASQIVETVKEHAKGRAVKTIRLIIGSLSGVQKESLFLYLPELLRASDMEDTDVEARVIRARMECACGHTYETDDLLDACPHCGKYERTIVDGKDCMIENIEVHDG